MSLESLDITEQEVNPISSGRLPDGRFAPKNQISVGNGAGAGYARPSKRLASILNEKTPQEIITKASTVDNDTEISGLEAGVYKRAAAFIQGDRGDAEFAFGYLEGKPTQKQELTGKDGGPLSIATADVTNLLLELSSKVTGE